MLDVATALRLESAGEGRIVLYFGDIIKDFIQNAAYARRDLVAANPDLVRRFLAGWYETIAYMRTHKDESITVALPIVDLPPDLAARGYDQWMEAYSRDGRFDPVALGLLAKSFVEMGLLPGEPDMKTALYRGIPAAAASSAFSSRLATFSMSWPRLSRPSRSDRHVRAFRCEIAGTSPAMTSIEKPRYPERKDNMAARIIALEEHFWTPELIALRRTVDQVNPKSVERLGDLGALRLREMDAAGIDVQVLSEAEPGVQNLAPEQAVPLARVSNDLLFEAVKRSPGRFAGFATLPTPDPAAAARELERTVKELSLLRRHGARIEPRPFSGRARSSGRSSRARSALDVPIYLHPCTPQPAVFEAYYKDYPQLGRAALGFGIEMAVQAARLVVSGVFDEFPKLKIILGHLGEALPFVLWRANDTLSRRAKLRRSFREYFRDHFYITTSGNFSQPALQCAIAELGVERILFAVDWPFQPNGEAVDVHRGRRAYRSPSASKYSARNARRLLRI